MRRVAIWSPVPATSRARHELHVQHNGPAHAVRQPTSAARLARKRLLLHAHERHQLADEAKWKSSATTSRRSKARSSHDYSYNTTSKLLDKATINHQLADDACGAIAKANPLNLITTFTFDAKGTVRTIDGARTDVADVTTTRSTDAPADAGRWTCGNEPQDRVRLLCRWVTEAAMGRRWWLRRSCGARLHYKPQESWKRSRIGRQCDAIRVRCVGRQTMVTTRTVGALPQPTIWPVSRRCIWKGWNSATPPVAWRSTDAIPSCNWDPAEYVSAGSDGRLRYVELGYTDNGKQKSGQGCKQQRDRAHVRQARPLALYAVYFSQRRARCSLASVSPRNTTSCARAAPTTLRMKNCATAARAIQRQRRVGCARAAIKSVSSGRASAA